MANLRIYRFYEGGIIPGIPGLFSAGQEITVDLDTMEIVFSRLIGQPPDLSPAPSSASGVEAPQPEEAPTPDHQEG